MKTALARVMVIVSVAAVALFLRDVVFFNTYEHAFCHGVVLQAPDACSAYNFRCVNIPANCDNNWEGWIAANRFHFSSIVLPNFGKASILGYLWFILQLLWGTIVNVFLYAINLLREPLVTNPALYVAVLVGLTALWVKKSEEESYGSGRQAFDPMNRAGLESPLGEAGFARVADVHAGLKGVTPDYVRAPPIFED